MQPQILQQSTFESLQVNIKPSQCNIHDWSWITRMYNNSPFRGASKSDVSCSVMGFNASILADTVILVPLHIETLKPKPKLAHMHHYCSLVYIVEK